MSKFAMKYNFNAKGIMHVEDGVIYIENEDTGELVNIPSLLSDFSGRECTLAITYAEDIE